MKKLYKYNLLLYIPLLILNLISLFNMYNAKYISVNYNHFFIKQLVWFTLGYLLIFLIKKININNLFKYAKYFYYLSLIFLILVLFIGKVTNGSRCWLSLFGFTFQPSELTKLALTLYIIDIINNTKIKNFKDELLIIFKLLIITLIPSILVFLEPDTGAIISFLIILGVSLIYLKLNKKWYITAFTIVILLLIFFFYCYFFNKDLLIKLIGTSFFYRMDRLINFTNGNSYQLEQALINIGVTSLFGQGLNNISLYIPEAPTDFIFAFLTNTNGLIIAITAILSFLIIDIFLLLKLNKVKNKNSKLLIYCYLTIFIFHQIYNIGMNLGLFPIMGIPLPFLSYGGSSTLINYLFLGIILKLK